MVKFEDQPWGHKPYAGRKPGRDLNRTVACTFCLKRFKTTSAAADHERSFHKKRLKDARSDQTRACSNPRSPQHARAHPALPTLQALLGGVVEEDEIIPRDRCTARTVACAMLGHTYRFVQVGPQVNFYLMSCIRCRWTCPEEMLFAQSPPSPFDNECRFAISKPFITFDEWMKDYDT